MFTITFPPFAQPNATHTNHSSLLPFHWRSAEHHWVTLDAEFSRTEIQTCCGWKPEGAFLCLWEDGGLLCVTDWDIV